MKKKNNGLVIVLVLIVLVLGGYIIYDKMQVQEKKDDNEQVEKEKNDTKKEDNLEQIGDYLFEKEEKYELYALGSETFKNDGKLSQNQVFAFYYYLMSNSNLGVTKDKIDNYVKDLYNMTLSEYPDIKLEEDTVALFYFDKEKNEYATDGYGHGPFTLKPAFSKVAKVEKDNDNYSITVTRVYMPIQDNDFEAGTPEQEYYADRSYTTKIEKLHEFVNIYDANGELIKSELAKAQEYYEQNYDEFKDIKPQYKYTFKKENDDYYLVSVEVIK